MRVFLRHARFGWRGPDVRRRELTTLFHGVNTWLRATDVEHWIAYGTLLGWHRSGALLPHDTDIDFGTTLAGYEVLRRAGARLPPGFVLRDSSHRHYGPKLYITHRGWEADVYVYVPRGENYCPVLRSREPGDVVPLPRRWIEPRRPVTFLGALTFVPADPEPCLTTFYGYIGPDAVRDPDTRYFRPRQPAVRPPETTVSPP